MPRYSRRPPEIWTNSTGASRDDFEQRHRFPAMSHISPRRGQCGRINVSLSSHSMENLYERPFITHVHTFARTLRASIIQTVPCRSILSRHRDVPINRCQVYYILRVSTNPLTSVQMKKYFPICLNPLQFSNFN